ncbi:MAG: lipid A export permease/ATP-binding protein MsbA [Deltaproteobacteria bacterium]|nr:lipid A export permease/ATP-binding protein MsbA [Deltaproteobacteria bacterium]
MIYHRILVFVKPYWFRLLMAMMCMILVASLTAAMAYTIKPVVDEIFMEKDMAKLKFLPFVIVLLFVMKGSCEFGQGYLMNYVGLSIIKRLRDELYSHIQMLPLSFFHKQETGVLMARIMNDVSILKEMVSNAITAVIKEFFTIVFLLGLIFYQDWKLALIAIVVLPFATIPIVKFGRRMRKLSTRCQESVAGVSSLLHETFTGNKIVKAFGMEPYENRRFFEKTLVLFTYEMKAVAVRCVSSPVMALLGGVGIAFVVFYGGHGVVTGVSTPGTFFSFITAVMMLYDPIRKLSPLNNTIQEGLAAAVRIFDILDTESEIIDRQDAGALESGHHGVVFRNVSFKYEDQMVLRNINLEVKSGRVIALVGMSGGGKTTLVNLIPRFYDVTDGAVLIDEHDVQDVTIASLRSQIGIVTQDPILFNDTIGNNIAYGNIDAAESDIIAAAKAAYAYDFIESFPEKFGTIVGEQGVRLSGGEKQRICIARALLKDAPILILDEATSSLDTESEQAVQGALENLMKGRTTFVIAHRLSTIRHADRIIVVVDGKIVEEGTHEDLLALLGEYHKLYELQFEDNNQ